MSLVLHQLDQISDILYRPKNISVCNWHCYLYDADEDKHAMNFRISDWLSISAHQYIKILTVCLFVCNRSGLFVGRD